MPTHLSRHMELKVQFQPSVQVPLAPKSSLIWELSYWHLICPTKKTFQRETIHGFSKNNGAGRDLKSPLTSSQNLLLYALVSPIKLLKMGQLLVCKDLLRYLYLQCNGRAPNTEKYVSSTILQHPAFSVIPLGYHRNCCIKKIRAGLYSH